MKGRHYSDMDIHYWNEDDSKCETHNSNAASQTRTFGGSWVDDAAVNVMSNRRLLVSPSHINIQHLCLASL